MIPFTNPILKQNIDTSLDEKLTKEAPILVCLFNQCYLSLIKYVGNHDIMSSRPLIFKDYAKHIWNNENSLIHWFNSMFIKDLLYKRFLDYL